MVKPSLLPLHLSIQIRLRNTLLFVPHCRAKNTTMAHAIRIVVVGDVHDDWDTQQDAKALQSLKPDLVLFTGDFGDENVELVKDVSSLDLPKVAILGNHDCWNTGKFSSTGVDSVEAQLSSLGKEHVGYDRLDFPQLKLSVVGGRPFSCGGKRIFCESLIAKRYGVKNMNESARKICESALRAPHGNSIILLAHNGPTGLGSNMNDICGRDWVVGGGDHGDPDLAEAISYLKDNSQLKLPLVIFGHMHKRLADSDNPRTMLVMGDNGIFYLNGAIVPRVEHLTTETVDETTSSNGNYSFGDRTSSTTKRVFTVIELINGKPRKITEVWVTVNEEVNKIEESILFESS